MCLRMTVPVFCTPLVLANNLRFIPHQGGFYYDVFFVLKYGYSIALCVDVTRKSLIRYINLITGMFAPSKALKTAVSIKDSRWPAVKRRLNACHLTTACVVDRKYK